MYAVIRTGGKQYRVAPGEVIKIEKLDGEVGGEVIFDDVLMVGGDGEPAVGRPRLESVRVRGKIVAQDRARKIVVFKHKRRKGYRVKKGHRQHFTGVAIESIETSPARQAEPVATGGEEEDE